MGISRGYNNTLEQDAKLLQVMGWGITAWGDKVASPMLMETELQVTLSVYIGFFRYVAINIGAFFIGKPLRLLE